MFGCSSCTLDNKAVNDVPIRPNELDLLSESTQKFSINCLQVCEASHADCQGGSRAFENGELTRGVAISDLPSRLLQVEHGNNLIKLVEMSSLTLEEQENVSDAGFVSLSYCWGGDQLLKLVKDSLAMFKDGIARSTLPKTLQDAIFVTDSIGLSYIWIDSLCILQDDDKDKELEIARMSTYYSANSVTICAASASTCEEGFLAMRSDTYYDARPFQFPFETRDGTGSILLYMESEPLEPTTERAWTLQETLLSRRILVFSSKQLYWCCATANAGCGGPSSELQNRILGDPETLVPGIYPLKVLELYPMTLQWRRIVEEFMVRKLGFANDKLLAVSAIAASLHRAFIERHGNIVYLAGLFFSNTDTNHTSGQLLWYTKAAKSKRADIYRSPSWSWACLDGPIHHLLYTSYYPLPSNLDQYHIRYRILEYGTDLLTPSAPYGAVSGGFLLIQAPLRAPDASLAIPRRVIVDPETPACSLKGFGDNEETYLGLFPDAEEDQPQMSRGLSGKDEIVCLELVSYTPKRASPIGLVLARCAGEKVETCRRIGIFIFCRSKEGKYEPDAWRAARESFFADVTLQDVRIV